MRRLVMVVLVLGAVGALGAAAAALAGDDYGYGGGSTSQSTAAASSASSETYVFKAALTRGQEVPRPVGAKATAAGTFSATTKEQGSTRTFHWKLTFRNLTGKAVAAHVHMGKRGVSGPVLIPLCGPCRNGQTGTLKITSAAEDAMERGNAYVNVHTAKNKGGEIRGQIRVVAS